MSKRRGVAFVVPAVAIIAILWLILKNHESNDRLSASGTVEATESQLGFLVPGRVEEIGVNEGDVVKAGQELAALDRTEALAHEQEALARADAARALLEELLAGTRKEEIAQARAAKDAAGEKLDDVRRDYEKAVNLFNGGAISRESLDKARTAYDVAQSQLVQAEELVRQLETGPRKEKIEAQRAVLVQAEASVAAARAVLSNMIIHAPFDGIITIRHREPGEAVPAGSPVLTLQNRDDRWVRIYVPEARIGAVHAGSRATITTDTYRDRTYSGEVTFISTEAEFTPKTVQTTEERVRLVYAVKVRITSDESYDLKPGMPADVRLDLSK